MALNGVHARCLCCSCFADLIPEIRIVCYSPIFYWIHPEILSTRSIWCAFFLHIFIIFAPHISLIRFHLFGSPVSTSTSFDNIVSVTFLPDYIFHFTMYMPGIFQQDFPFFVRLKKNLPHSCSLSLFLALSEETGLFRRSFWIGCLVSFCLHSKFMFKLTTETFYEPFRYSSIDTLYRIQYRSKDWKCWLR